MSNSTAIVHVPTVEEVRNLKVGDLALDSFGRYAEVMEIRYHGTDVNGAEFVGYAVRFGDDNSTSTITGSYKAGELVRTTALSREKTSAELDKVERETNLLRS